SKCVSKCGSSIRTDFALQIVQGGCFEIAVAVGLPHCRPKIRQSCFFRCSHVTVGGDDQDEIAGYFRLRLQLECRIALRITRHEGVQWAEFLYDPGRATR